MHHKRKGPKSTRSGCMMCKMHKHQGWSKASRYPKQYAYAAQDEEQAGVPVKGRAGSE